MISGKALLAGVMGDPITHTLSPRLHGFWIQTHGIDGAYIPLHVVPKNLEKAITTLPALGFRGVNLTIPHKETAMVYMDHIEPKAKKIGAINTVVVQNDGSLIGSNTDIFGFTENLKEAGYQAGSIATVLGAGGAARAICVALQDMGHKEIRLVNRHLDRAQKLAEAIEETAKFSLFAFEEKEKALKGASLLVNATSLGMNGKPPLEIDLKALPREAWVTDAVYAPLETGLLRQARERKLNTVDGLGMLLHQARAGFKAWFGCEPKVTQALRDTMLEKA